MTNESGSVTDTLVFDAFGNETAKTGSTDNSYGFQGEEKDETGLYYLRARYMDPATGTFMSMDTYGGSLTDPMSLHKYLFANSNPVAYCDPSGHYTLTAQETNIAIQAIIGEAMSGIFYIADWFLTDPESEHHSIPMMVLSMMIGLMQGAVMGCGGGIIAGLISSAGFSILDCFLVGIMFTLFSWDLKLAAIDLKDSGNWFLAALCDTGADFAGFVGLCALGEGFSRGLEKLKEKAFKTWPRNKKGFIRIGGWSDTADNSLSGYGNYEFKEGVDIDLRGKGSYKEALDIAFEKTGVPKDQFEITKWGKDKYGKSFPVEWRSNNGAEVNIDIGHSTNGSAPSIPHVGWQTGGKRGSGGGVRGHIFVDDVPYNR